MLFLNSFLLYGAIALMGLVFLFFVTTVIRVLSKTIAEKREIDRKNKKSELSNNNNSKPSTKE